MKWLIFCGLLFFHLSVAQIDGTCEECIDFIQASSQLFASNEVVDITGTFLKQNVCPQMSDVEGTQSLKIIQYCERSELRLHFEWTKVCIFF